MQPFFADAIDIPVVFFAGIMVLVPLLAFEVFIEALILKPCWRQPYGQLCKFTFTANLLSLVAGIPTELLNSILDSNFLPQDIPGFFARYPVATVIDSLIYFGVTLLVEGAYAYRWRRGHELAISKRQIWRGVFLANFATYAVLAPLNYYAAKPACQVQQFTNDTRWTTHPAESLLYVDAKDHYLKSIRLDGLALETVVVAPMTDYLVSSNLSVCLFRGTNQDLSLYRRDHGRIDPIWKTDARFQMNEVAFSPSGERVAFASREGDFVEVVNLSTGRRTRLTVIHTPDFDEPILAWSLNETNFFIRGVPHAVLREVTIGPTGDLFSRTLTESNTPPILPCYGRLGATRWYGGGDWGVAYNQDNCGDLTAVAWPGLDSSLKISLDDLKTNATVLTISVRPGLLHLAGFYFSDAAFLSGCGECLFESNDYIYLLDVHDKRVGTLTHGDRFILLTPRYKKIL